MVLYGMQIVSDIAFDIALPSQGEYKETIYLSSHVPSSFAQALTCGTYLHTTHKHKIYLYSNQDIAQPMLKKQPFCYEVKGLLKFYWYHGETTLYYKRQNASLAQFTFWFTHPFFPLFLSMESYYVLLHGSAIEIAGKSILILAPFHSGKSTFTHYINQQNNPLICDDILPTFIENGQIHYAPSHPYSRPFREAETLGHRVPHYRHTFGKIDAIYILRNHQTSLPTTICSVKGVEKFQCVKQNSIIYTLKNFRLTHEQYLGKLLNSLAFFILDRPWGKEHLAKSYHTLKKHIEETL